MSLRMVRLVTWSFYLRGHVTWYKLRPTALPEPGSCSFFHSSFSSFTLSTRLSTAHLSTIRWSQQSWASRSVSELRNRDFAHVLHFWCTVHFHKISPPRIVPRVVIIQQWVRSCWKVAIIGRGETDTKFCTSIMTSTILVLHTHRPGPAPCELGSFVAVEISQTLKLRRSRIWTVCTHGLPRTSLCVARCEAAFKEVHIPIPFLLFGAFLPRCHGSALKGSSTTTSHNATSTLRSKQDKSVRSQFSPHASFPILWFLKR